MGYDANADKVNVGDDILATDLNDALDNIETAIDANESLYESAKAWAVGPGDPPVVDDEVETGLYAAKKYAADAAADLVLTNADVVTTNADVVLCDAAVVSASSTAGAALWLVGTTYNSPDAVIGSDGQTYRCIGTSVLADNPVGSVTGDWVQITGIGSRENLYMNSDFAMNQRAYANDNTVITTGSFGHDRVKSISSLGYTVTNRALTIDTGTMGYISDELKAEHGNSVTISVVSGSLTVGATAGASSTVVTASAPYTFTLATSGTEFITFTAATAALGIKIERGVYQSAYELPEPVAEANRCYKYYVELNGADAATSTISASHSTYQVADHAFFIQTPVPMRELPTITIAVCKVQGDLAGNYEDVVYMQALVLNPTGLTLKVNLGSNTAGGSTYLIIATDNGYIKLDAEY